LFPLISWVNWAIPLLVSPGLTHEAAGGDHQDGYWGHRFLSV
jgi:hypothetical protein